MLQLFRKPKIHQLQMTVRINEHVLGLHVSVCDTLVLMKEFEDEDHLGHVEPSSVFVEACRSAQVREDLTPWAIVELCAVSMLEAFSSAAIRTSMYKQSRSAKLVIMVVMKG